jgi:hypothetical protein
MRLAATTDEHASLGLAHGLGFRAHAASIERPAWSWLLPTTSGLPSVSVCLRGTGFRTGLRRRDRWTPMVGRCQRQPAG